MASQQDDRTESQRPDDSPDQRGQILSTVCSATPRFGRRLEDIPLVKDAALCDLCTGITLERLTKASPVPHQPSFQALDQSAANSCHMCKLFRRAVLDAYKGTREHPRWSEERGIEYQLWRDDHVDGREVPRSRSYGDTDVSWAAGFSIERFQPPFTDKVADFGIKYQRRRNIRHNNKSSWSFDSNSRFEDVDDTAVTPTLLLSTSDRFHQKLNGRYTSCKADFNLCRQWIWLCAEAHEGCPATKGTTLPSRVIDLGLHRADSPRLVETYGGKGIYVTLSHCWGVTRPLVTDSTNYTKHLDAIPFASLPKTFSDAIKVTRELGYRYIWIDSLCIIQDSPKDWETQCAQMSEIYHNSVVTLAAPSASGPQAGFPLERAAPTVEPCLFPGGREVNFGIDIVLSLNTREALLNPSRGPAQEKRSPLESRAWVLQERLLSPRTLYFGSSQLYFECRTDTWYECVWEHLISESRTPMASPIGSLRLEKRDFDFRRFDPENWFLLVRDYTDCNLTSRNDKLPALSGVARKISEQSRDRYLAGLWLRDLVNQLAWVAQRPTRSELVLRTLPSWTWVKCDGRIFCGNAELEADATVIYAMTTPKGEDPYGDVVAGSIMLTGRLRKFYLSIEDEYTQYLYPEQSQIGNRGEESEYLSWSMDEDALLRLPRDTMNGKEIDCLMLGKSYQHSAGITVLTLDPCDGLPNGFRRTGCAYGVRYDHKEQQKPRHARRDMFPEWAQVKKQMITLI